MYYFAYGSDLNLKLMRQVCPKCKQKSKATLPNYKLIFTGWSRQWRSALATLKRSVDDKVIGGIYEITDVELMLLDKNVGYPTVHGRMNITVFTEDNEPIEAVTYIRHGQIEEKKPSPEYAALIRQGYKEWDII
jgi:hypothetical protein